MRFSKQDKSLALREKGFEGSVFLLKAMSIYSYPALASYDILRWSSQSRLDWDILHS